MSCTLLRYARPLLLLPLLLGCNRLQAPPSGQAGAESRLRLAAAAEAGGQGELALSLYAGAAANDAGNAEAQARYADALARAGQLEQAQQVLGRALGRQPEAPGLLLALGRTRLRAGAAAPALEAFDRLLRLKRDHVQALAGRGVALDLLGQHAEAERSHRAALALLPESEALGNNLAMSLLLAGRAAEAVAVLEPLAQRPGAAPRVAVNLAMAQAAAGRPDARPEGVAPEEMQRLVLALAPGRTP